MEGKKKMKANRLIKKIALWYLLALTKIIGVMFLMFGYYSRRSLFMIFGFIILDLSRSYINYTIKLYKSVLKYSKFLKKLRKTKK